MPVCSRWARRCPEPAGGVGRRTGWIPSLHPITAETEPRVLEIEVDETAEYTLCRPVGELDAYTVTSFREALGELATRPRVIIDLSEVPFMDSAGLGALIGGIRRAREHGGEVAVACSRPTLTRLLHTTGFDRIVPVTETLAAAVAALAGDAEA